MMPRDNLGPIKGLLTSIVLGASLWIALGLWCWL